MSSMPPANIRAVQQHRSRLRAKGLRPVQLWLPDTRSPRFAAQVAHDIAVLARLSPADEAMLDAFEQMAEEDLRAWS
jgi:hypothetical protein